MPRKKKVEDISHYQTMVKRMCDADTPLVSLYDKIEDAVDGKWELPAEVQELDWVGPVISTDPSTAVETGVRTLGSEKAKWFITPTAPGPENQDKTNALEDYIKFQWKWAQFRSDIDYTKDIVRSAIVYGRVCVHVTHLKMELEAAKAAGADIPPWYEDVEGYGDFDITVASPKNVRFKKGKYGLEAVANVYQDKVSDVIEDYKPFAQKLYEDYVAGDYEDFDCTVVDLTTRDRRVIWVTRQFVIDAEDDIKTAKTKAVDSMEYVLLNVPREMPFIPWAIRSGGTSLRSDVEKKVQPMLAKVVETNLVDIQNTMLSLTYSEAITTVASPRFAVVGPNNEIVHVDYRDPTRLMDVPENHQVIQLQPRSIDEGLLHLSDRIKAMVDRETVARFLQNLDIPDEAAYASINAVMQSAIAALDVYKDIAEYIHADIGILMLKTLHYRKDAAVFFGVDESNRQMLVNWNMFDPKHLYVEAELTAKAPTDYMQRLNAGVAMKQNLSYPEAEVYRWLGESDPEGLAKKAQQEKVRDFVLNLQMQKMQFAQQMEMEKAKMALQMEAQAAAQQQASAQQQAAARQQMAAQQQGQQSGDPRAAMARMMASRQQSAARGGAMGRPNPAQREAFAMARQSGGRFNPSQGGTPPATMNPGATREMLSGMDRRGGQVQ